MSLITDEIRAKASQLYHGDEICQVKSKFLLTEVGLPNGLLPLKDIIECGYIEETGFVWLIQKNKCEHRFEKINRPVKYAAEVTAYVEPNKIKKLTGVKTKELLVWVNLSDIYVDDPPTGKVTFKTPTGLSRSFPVEAFQIEVAGGGGGGGEAAAADKEEVKEDEAAVDKVAENGGAEVSGGVGGGAEVGKEEEVKVVVGVVDGAGGNNTAVEVKEV